MRPARVIPGGRPPVGPARSSANLPPLVAVAHGSKDPRATATIAGLMGLVRSQAARGRARSSGLPGLDAREAFLDHCAPSLGDALKAISRGGDPPYPPIGASGAARDVVLVPLLLTAAYHSKSDIPAQVAAAAAVLAKDGLPRCRVRQAATLGPHPLLIAGLERRLAQAAVVSPGETSVVLAAAGSSDPQANEMVATLAARLQAAGRWRRVVPAYASASSPSPAEAIRALHARFPRHRVVVATYLLAPGYFADKIEAQALEAGAVAVSAPLGAIPEVANVILDRYEATLGQARARLSPGPVSDEDITCSHRRTDSGCTLVSMLCGSGRTPLQWGRAWTSRNRGCRR
jgi:sirohydrochlorin ferrochelatase